MWCSAMLPLPSHHCSTTCVVSYTSAASHPASHSHSSPPFFPPLQVATLRESSADFRKFYVHSGTSVLPLRAESKEDRWVWMQALQTSKGSWEGMTPAEASALKRDAAARIVAQDEQFMAHLLEVRVRVGRQEWGLSGGRGRQGQLLEPRERVAGCQGLRKPAAASCLCH